MINIEKHMKMSDSVCKDLYKKETRGRFLFEWVSMEERLHYPENSFLEKMAF